MTEYYADTPAIDPATGELVMAGSIPALGQPTAQIVLLTLRTELGTNATDSEDGTDYGPAEQASPDTAVRMKDKITRALAPLTESAVIKDLRVAVQVKGQTLLYEASFVDPRSGERQKVKGSR